MCSCSRAKIAARSILFGGFGWLVARVGCERCARRRAGRRGRKLLVPESVRACAALAPVGTRLLRRLQVAHARLRRALRGGRRQIGEGRGRRGVVSPLDAAAPHTHCACGTRHLQARVRRNTRPAAGSYIQAIYIYIYACEYARLDVDEEGAICNLQVGALVKAQGRGLEGGCTCLEWRSGCSRECLCKAVRTQCTCKHTLTADPTSCVCESGDCTHRHTHTPCTCSPHLEDHICQRARLPVKLLQGGFVGCQIMRTHTARVSS